MIYTGKDGGEEKSIKITIPGRSAVVKVLVPLNARLSDIKNKGTKRAISIFLLSKQ